MTAYQDKGLTGDQQILASRFDAICLAGDALVYEPHLSSEDIASIRSRTMLLLGADGHFKCHGFQLNGYIITADHCVEGIKINGQINVLIARNVPLQDSFADAAVTLDNPRCRLSVKRTDEYLLNGCQSERSTSGAANMQKGADGRLRLVGVHAGETEGLPKPGLADCRSLGNYGVVLPLETMREGLLGGQVDLTVATAGLLPAYTRDAKVIPLAVTGKSRWPSLPNRSGLHRFGPARYSNNSRARNLGNSRR